MFRSHSSASTYRECQYKTNLDVNTQHRTLKTRGGKSTPLVQLNNYANVEVVLCVQPINREYLTVAQKLTARVRATPIYQCLTAKLGCIENRKRLSRVTHVSEITSS